MVAYLCSKTNDFNYKDKDGKTPLFIAAETNNYDHFMILAEKVSPLMTPDKSGSNPLKITTDSKISEFIETEIEKRKPASYEPKTHDAFYKDDIESIKYNIECLGTDVNERYYSNSILIDASDSKKDDIVKYLIDKGMCKRQ